MQNKRKITTAIVVSVVAVALLLGGTFAWQSINQTALNEASDVINPGGRLHDDFDGSNKDVYVENFADEDIFARIQLSEYFAIIANYDPENPNAAQTVRNEIIGTLNEDGTYNYVTYKFDTNANGDGSFKAAVDADGNPYWNWTTGGSTAFMPTFNLNKDSLVADINGTYVDAIGGISNRDGNQYTDYTKYEVGATETGTEIYDGDTNMADEVGTNFDKLDQYPDNIVTVENVTHTAKNTGNGTLISMADWLAMIEENGGYDATLHGNYWVYDTDGWVYWSAPIASGEATGLLLDGIALNGVMDDTWYYAINVVAQFVTADDVGQNDGTGFYDEANGSAPSTDAENLLDLIGVEMNEDEDNTGDNGDNEGGETPNADYITIGYSAADSADFDANHYVKTGETLQLTLTANIDGVDEIVDIANGTDDTWNLVGKDYSANTSISDTGLLTIGADEADPRMITVKATYQGVETEYEVLVADEAIVLTIVDEDGNSANDTYTWTTGYENYNFDVTATYEGADLDLSVFDVNWNVLAYDGSSVYSETDVATVDENGVFCAPPADDAYYAVRVSLGQYNLFEVEAWAGPKYTEMPLYYNGTNDTVAVEEPYMDWELGKTIKVYYASTNNIPTSLWDTILPNADYFYMISLYDSEGEKIASTSYTSEQSSGGGACYLTINDEALVGETVKLCWELTPYHSFWNYLNIVE